MKRGITIHNPPDYEKDYRFIVYRIVDNKAWFYGAYNDAGKACEVAMNIDGFVKDKGAENG